MGKMQTPPAPVANATDWLMSSLLLLLPFLSLMLMLDPIDTQGSKPRV